MAYTEEQLKAAARKAIAAGDTAAATRLVAAARAAGQAQPMTDEPKPTGPARQAQFEPFMQGPPHRAGQFEPNLQGPRAPARQAQFEPNMQGPREMARQAQFDPVVMQGVPPPGPQAVPPMSMPQSPELALQGPGAGGGMQQLFDAGILPRRYQENQLAAEEQPSAPAPTNWPRFALKPYMDAQPRAPLPPPPAPRAMRDQRAVENATQSVIGGYAGAGPMMDEAALVAQQILKERSGLSESQIRAIVASFTPIESETPRGSDAIIMSPERIAQQAAIDQALADQLTLSSVPAGAAPFTKGLQGLPFVGEYSDELTGAVGRGMESVGLVSPGTGDRAMNQQRAVQDAYGRQSPIGSAVAATAGGILGSIPLAAAAGPAMLAKVPGSMVGKVAAGAVTGAAVGGTEGAVSGYGAGNDGDRGAEAATRGLIGAGLGGALGMAAPLAASGIRRIAERLKGRDVAVIKDTLNVSTDAARVIKAQLDSDDFTAAAASIQRAGPDAMLADAGPAAGQLLDTAMQSGGAATRIGRDAVEKRAADAGKRVTNMLNTVLGKPEGTRAASKSIAQRTSGIRETAYNRAFDTPIDYGTGGGGEGVLAALQRIPSRYLSQAAQKANELAQLRGVPNYRQIVVSIDDAGKATLSELPNVRQLHQLKLAMDDIARDGTDAITGKVSGDAGAVKEAAKGLRAALGDAVPAYNSAAKLGGDKIAEDQALELGRKLLSTATTRETVRDSMAGASLEARDALRRGLRQQIDDTLANVQRTLTDPNTDAREAIKLVKDMSSRANREKVEAALGATRAKTLFRALDEATAQLELRSSVARNSATAARQAGQEAVKEITAPGALGSLMQGEPGQGMRKLVQALSGQTGAKQVADRQALYAEIARALTKQRGPDAERSLQAIQAAMQGQPIKSADAVRIARQLTGAGALGSYQSGQQYLARP